MIKDISIQGFKSFPVDTPCRIQLDHTKRVVLFYGLNGAGKSAIGQIIYQNGNKLSSHPQSSLTLTRSEQFQYLVYNDDFVEDNFRNQDGFPGIFSIGQQDSTALQEAEEKQQERQGLEERQDELIKQRGQREQEGSAAFEAVCEATWRIYTDHSSGLLNACTEGYGNSKKKLFDKMQLVALETNEIPASIDNLTMRMQDVDTDQPSVKSHVVLDFTGLNDIETSTLWSTPIFGSTDSILAPFIQELGNIDWVREGQKFLSEDVCPFCQQDLPADFKDELIRLIDKVYTRQVDEIEGLATQYAEKIEALSTAVKTMMENERFAKEHSDIDRCWSMLHKELSQSLALMRQKHRTPGESFSIASSRATTQAVSTALAEVNERIVMFNERIRNRQTERQTIKNDFWKRMRHDYAGAVDVYTAAKLGMDTAIAAIDEELENIGARLTAIETRLGELRANSVGTERAVEAINRCLRALGIQAFKIKKKAGEGNLYCLERPSIGVDEYKSLSEGEKTLISFFYFVELVKGSAAADTTIPQDKKIVVIDDPISSLSHNYVYDIALIIAHEIIEGEKKVRQVFLLTHSLFFYHELLKQISRKGQCQYFRVLKHEHSLVVPMGKDEIQNEYQAFWQVIKDAMDGSASIAPVPNAMRCIFEHFFSFTDQQDDFKKALRGLGEEDHTFVPLARYLDRKSHANSINLTDFGDHDIQYYLGKFRAVFECTRYLDHYAKMMGEETPAQPANEPEPEVM